MVRKILGLLFISIMALCLNLSVMALQLDKKIGLYLQFDKSGDPGLDSSIYGNNAEIKGKAKLVAGKYGSAMEFGGSDYLLIQSSDSLQMSDTGFSLAMWIKTKQKTGAANASWAMTIEKGDWNTGNWGMNYPGYSLSKVRFQSFENGFLDSKTGDDVLSNGEWQWIAGVLDAKAKVWRVYVNGVMEVEEAKTLIFTPDKDPVTVASRVGTSGFFTGTLDEVLYANGPLTEDELKKHLNGQLAPVEPVGKLATAWGRIKGN
jgi:hypothetical protein